MENSISLNKYTKLIIKDWKIIAYFMVGMLALAVIYGLIFYHPSYESTSKILIKNKDATTFIVDLGNASEYSPSGQNQNPILTQMEILSSTDMAERVLDKVAKDLNLDAYPRNQITQVFTRILGLKNPPGTEIIEISVKWNKADEAQKIAEAYHQAYVDYNVSLNKKAVSQKKVYIKEQLDKSSKKLAQIRQAIQNYRNKTFSVNIDQEAVSVIDQITTIENQIAGVDSQLKSEKSKNIALAGKLNVDVKDAIKSVAIGQNANLNTLQQNLQDAQQKYASLNAKYPPTNIQMRALADNIQEIKNQIKSQMLINIGKSFENKSNSVISDPVRMKMVDDYVASHVNIESVTAQKESLASTLADLKAKQEAIPEKQNMLQSLIQEETVAAQIVETLSTKLIEAEVRESEIVSGVSVIEKPSLPVSESFPTMVHIILMFEFIGLLLGVAIIIGLYYVQDICEGTGELEEIIQSSVFGVIPWLSASSYKNTGNAYNPSSAISIAYQKIITSLKIKCYKKQAKAIAFSSAEFGKKRSVISVNIAKSLAKANNSVVLIDADFRDGCIDKEFNLNTAGTPDLASVLMEICNPKSLDNKLMIDYNILKALIKVPGEPKLSVIFNNNMLDNPYEILTSEAFAKLIEFLKEKFDFVIVDTPPILAVPDSLTVSQYVDGLVILCGIKTSRSKIRRIRKLCTDHYVDIIGAVARDSHTEFEIPENQYIKQLSFDDEVQPETT
jgi:uncharacterized protein involved in exopolysaccharide biosynthesis/Mrp family chromosome partitioning ATPase